MAQIGSSKDIISQSNTGLFDDLGNSVVSGDTSFAASPLGVAARSQAIYGIPNPSFNLTPPDPNVAIDNEANPLPYWTIENESSGVMTATTIFDGATETWAVELDPGTAAVDSTLILTTRSYLLTDDNLALRQRALAVLEKSGTAAGTTEWNLQLSATYYSATGSALSTAVIGTALDTATWTSFAGTTTPGGSAINSAAQYVDLAFTMTATAAVTGSAKATIKSLLLTTSVAGGGGSQSFIITEQINASTTWVAPTGVTSILAVIAVGAGGGGAGGGSSLRAGAITCQAYGGGGGGSGAWAIAKDIYVGDIGSVSIGIGAAGAGGTGWLFEKNAGSTSPSAFNNLNGNLGAAGGNTTFGTYLTSPGGGGGGTTAVSNIAGVKSGTVTSSIYGVESSSGTTGGSGFAGGGITGTAGAGSPSTLAAFSRIPYQSNSFITAGTAGGNGLIGTDFSPGTGAYLTSNGGAGGAIGLIAGAGGGSGAYARLGTKYVVTGGAGGNGAAGGGGGGISMGSGGDLPGTITGTAGDGGNAAANSGAGGGGGGGVAASWNSQSTWNAAKINIKSGAGGNGSNGTILIVYVG
jgi:hypothetical protein